MRLADANTSYCDYPCRLCGFVLTFRSRPRLPSRSTRKQSILTRCARRPRTLLTRCSRRTKAVSLRLQARILIQPWSRPLQPGRNATAPLVRSVRRSTVAR